MSLTEPVYNYSSYFEYIWEEVRRRFLVPAPSWNPGVLAAADENFMRFAVRFVVPIRSARSAKDDMIRRIPTAWRER